MTRRRHYYANERISDALRLWIGPTGTPDMEDAIARHTEKLVRMAGALRFRRLAGAVEFAEAQQRRAAAKLLAPLAEALERLASCPLNASADVVENALLDALSLSEELGTTIASQLRERAAKLRALALPRGRPADRLAAVIGRLAVAAYRELTGKEPNTSAKEGSFEHGLEKIYQELGIGANPKSHIKQQLSKIRK